MQVEKGYNKKNLRFSIVSFQPILRARSITVVHRIFTLLEILQGLIVKWYYTAFALPRSGFDSQ